MVYDDELTNEIFKLLVNHDVQSEEALLLMARIFSFLFKMHNEGEPRSKKIQDLMAYFGSITEEVLQDTIEK